MDTTQLFDTAYEAAHYAARAVLDTYTDDQLRDLIAEYGEDTIVTVAAQDVLDARADDMSLRPRPGETAEETIARVTKAVKG